MTTTIQIATDDISISRNIEVNGNTYEVEAFSFSPAITELSEKEELLTIMANHMIADGTIQKDQAGCYYWVDGGDYLIEGGEHE